MNQARMIKYDVELICYRLKNIFFPVVL